MSQIQTLLEWGVKHLAEHKSPSAPLDAQVLLSFVLQQSRTQLLAFGEREVSESDERRFRHLIEQRTEGYPVAYLTGEREFWSLNLYTEPSTLIPRPDTERLVEVCLETFPETDPDSAIHLVDLGTGTGAIALALATERSSWQIQAVDYSKEAVALARRNAERHLLDQRVQIHQNHWLDGFEPLSLDLVVSNPPYVAEQDPHLSEGDVRFEPKSALTSGQDGLDDIRLIAEQSRNVLKPSGWLILEHGYDQQAPVASLLEQLGYQQVECFQDYGGQPRVTRARLP